MKKNVRIFAAQENDGMMSIYIDCSGKKIYLMPHKNVSQLYNLLKDGIRLNDLKRHQLYKLLGKKSDVDRRRSRVIERSLKHVVDVAEEFIRYELDDEMMVA